MKISSLPSRESRGTGQLKADVRPSPAIAACGVFAGSPVSCSAEAHARPCRGPGLRSNSTAFRHWHGTPKDAWKTTFVCRAGRSAGILLATFILAVTISGSGYAGPFGKADRTIDITAFGAKGDGMADDSEAIRAAFAEAGRHDYDYVMVYAPPGNYRLGSPVSTPVLTGSSHFAFCGASPAATVFTIDNPQGGFEFTYRGGARKDSVDICSFGMDVANRHTGFCIRVVGPKGGGTTTRYDLRLEDLVLGTKNDLSENKYGVTGPANDLIHLSWIKRAIINRCFVWNVPPEALEEKELPRSLITLKHCYKPYIQNCYFNGAARIGILMENLAKTGGPARTEGTYIQNCTINGPRTSCLVRNKGPEFWFTDNHCNFKLQGLSFESGRKYVYIENNLMYVIGDDNTDALAKADIPWQTETGVTDFHLKGVYNAAIRGNIFRTVAAEPHPTSLVRTHYHIEKSRSISIRDDKYAAQSIRTPIFAQSVQGLFIYMHDQGWQRDFSKYTHRKPDEQVEYGKNVFGKLQFDGLDKTTEIFFNK